MSDTIGPPRILTAVYTFTDTCAFDAEWERLKPILMADSGPVRIHAVSRDDEMLRVQLIEEAADKYDDPHAFKEVVRDLFGCPDLSKWEWPE